MSAYEILALRSVDLAVPNLHDATSFYTKIWGLTLVSTNSTMAVLSATGADHHVLVLHQAGSPALLSITFRVAALSALSNIAERTLKAGGRVLEAAGPKPWPGGGTGLVIATPAGCVLRFIHGDETKPSSPEVAHLPSRLSHVNINSTNVDSCSQFFHSVLGFTLSDRSKLMAFLRTNADHHVIVIAQAPTNGLNHVAFMLPTLEGVMLGSGRMIDNGYPIGWGVGRHGPGNNVFAYFIDPCGIVIEYTAEVLQVDETYQVRGPDEWTWPPGRTDHWGIAPPKSEAVKQAQLSTPFAHS